MFFRALACLPALTGAWRHRGGGLARSVGAWAETNVDESVFDEPQLGPPTARRGGQHEPPGPGADRRGDGPPGDGAVRVERQSPGVGPQRRADAAGTDPRGPVHRGQRAVPDRHGPLCRRHLPGRHADRADRRRGVVGPPLPGLERSGHPTVGGGRAQHRAVAAPGAGHGVHRARAVRGRRVAVAECAARRRRRGAASAGFRAPVTARGPAALRRRRLRHGQRPGRAVQRGARRPGPRSAARLPPARRRLRWRRPAGRALSAGAHDAQESHTVPQHLVLPPPQARPRRGWSVRRARPRRRRGPRDRRGRHRAGVERPGIPHPHRPGGRPAATGGRGRAFRLVVRSAR